MRIWHFHEGAPLTVYILTTEGEQYEIQLGRDTEKGECFQAVVPAGVLVRRRDGWKLLAGWLHRGSRL